MILRQTWIKSYLMILFLLVSYLHQILIFLKCVCYMCACPRVWVHVSAYAYEGQRLCPLSLISLCLKYWGLLNPKLADWARLISQSNTVFTSRALRLQWAATPTWLFNMGSADPNSSLHTHAARTVSTLSPQPSVSICSFHFPVLWSWVRC